MSEQRSTNTKNRFLNSDKLPAKLLSALSDDKIKSNRKIDRYFKSITENGVTYLDLKLIQDISGINEYVRHQCRLGVDPDVESVLKSYITHGLLRTLCTIVTQIDNNREKTMTERSLNASLRNMCFSLLVTYTDTNCPIAEHVSTEVIDNHIYLASSSVTALTATNVLSNEHQTRLYFIRNLARTKSGIRWVSRTIKIFEIVPKFIYQKNINVAEHFIELYPSQSNSPPPEMDPEQIREGLTTAALRTLRHILSSPSEHVRENIKTISLLMVTSDSVLGFHNLIKPISLCITGVRSNTYLEMYVDVLSRIFDSEDARDLYLTWKRFIKRPIQRSSLPIPIVDNEHHHNALFSTMVMFSLACNKQFGSNGAVKFLLSFMKEMNSGTYLIDKFGHFLLDLAHTVQIKESSRRVITVQHSIVEYIVIFSGLGIKGELTIKPEFFDETLLEAALFCKRWELERLLTYKQLKQKTSRAVRYYARADLQFDENNFLEARRLYTKALAICPLSARPHQARFYRARANCHMKLHKYFHAIRDCSRALCLDPDEYVTVQFTRAKAYWRKKYYYRSWIDLVCMKDAYATRLIGGNKTNPAYDKLFNDAEGILKEIDDMDFIK